MTASRYIPLQAHRSHSRCSPQSSLAPTCVAPNIPGAVHRILATSCGYFDLSSVSPFHSPTGLAAPIPARAHGLAPQALSQYTHLDWRTFAGSIPLLVSRWPLARSVFDTWLSKQCDTSDHIQSGLSFDYSCPHYTNSRFKTACLKGRGFYPIYRQ